MPNFKQQEEELKTRHDKWLYFIKHLEDFQTIPVIFRDEVIFEQAFEKAELAKLDSLQAEAYKRSLKDFRDLKGMFDYATETAFDEGKTEAKVEVIKQGKLMGLPVADLSKLTGLTEDEINNL